MSLAVSSPEAGPAIDFSAVRRPLGEARGLPNAVYTDPDYHRREMARVLHGGWACLASASEVAAPGDVKPIEFGGAPLILLRDRGGEVRVFHNVCRHRGARLVQEAACRRPGLVCPYHAWSYALDGRLVKTPDVGGPGRHEIEGLDKATTGLLPVRSALWADFVFVDLSGSAPPLEDYLAPLTARWARYDFAALKRVEGMELTVQANWKLATENFLESYHLPVVHPALNGYSRLDDHYYFEAWPAVGAGVTSYAPPRTRENDGPPLPRFPGLDDESAAIGEYPVVFPNLWLGVQGDHFYGIVVYPEGPTTSREALHLYAAAPVAGDLALAPTVEQTMARWRLVFEEDIGPVQAMQAGRASPAFDGGVLTRYHDPASHRFMQAIAERMA
ncbi:Phenylpropionate dioxygenase, large terminal subunit [Tistlia consotensis]|uniref:Phenylpropionate dioxygenase, large terminal subunit n=1 Tax=Tistlia consotensis USBA 355 TaxID=560819 RepID=A0A1Y6CLU5_9PROT|nr:aromatic ring-hydroxylating dioxygenase subunit alpha [Tistlia consotensis]SMF74896.1 Phenylpropionate dioxygenase, large terminal subunit [Tistlia consotensis USBA 355]SNS11342.1 Phenylpropionate dioxygenase, large terminal subunit [Tistlia consotensis]